VRALLLKPTFAGRALFQSGRRVEVALEFSDLAQARTELRGLVSRPASSLDGPLIAAAAIESTVENLVDSWLAPLRATAFSVRAARTVR
jgi:adenosylcobinamide-phosphate synthase